MESNRQKKKKESNFVVQGSILAVASIVVRIIGIAYRIPMINIIGDEGMGYYGTAFNVYNIALLLSSYSLPLAVSKMVSARLAGKQYRNAARILRAALCYATIVGAFAAAVIWFGADFFARDVFFMPYAAFALKTLAPTVWIMAYLGVFRGYFQGQGTMVPTAFSQVFEQIVNAIISVAAGSFLFNEALKTRSIKEPDRNRLFQRLGSCRRNDRYRCGRLHGADLSAFPLCDQQKRPQTSDPQGSDGICGEL